MSCRVQHRQQNAVLVSKRPEADGSVFISASTDRTQLTQLYPLCWVTRVTEAVKKRVNISCQITSVLYQKAIFFQELKICSSQKLDFAQSTLREGLTFMELWCCLGMHLQGVHLPMVIASKRHRLQVCFFPGEKKVHKGDIDVL